ncbi:MAG: hypothetical protein R3178_07475, partial [Rhodothermales bacterium]|nr:hypothetical protein [Rhodothermales bacterium]
MSLTEALRSVFGLARCFSDFEGLNRFVEQTKEYRVAAEAWIADRQVVHCFCDRCMSVKAMTVNVGALFGTQPNLREGLRCECGLTNRQRLLYSAIARRLQGEELAPVCILEQRSVLFHYLSQLIPELHGSEYLGPEFASGSKHLRGGRRLVHQDLCDLSYASNSMGLIV